MWEVKAEEQGDERLGEDDHVCGTSVVSAPSSIQYRVSYRLLTEGRAWKLFELKR
jgi:hypothetical protein